MPCICNIPVTDQVTYLGVITNKNQNTRCPLNFNPITDKTQKKFNSLFQTHSSLRGRTLPANAEGVSRLIYAAFSLHVDSNVSKRTDSYSFKFLWKNKIHSVGEGGDK